VYNCNKKKYIYIYVEKIYICCRNVYIGLYHFNYILSLFLFIAAGRGVLLEEENGKCSQRNRLVCLTQAHHQHSSCSSIDDCHLAPTRALI